MACQHRRLGETFRSGGADVIGAEGVVDTRPEDPADADRGRNREDKGRQEQVAQSVARAAEVAVDEVVEDEKTRWPGAVCPSTRRREPTEARVEEDDSAEAEEERRRRRAEE